MPKLVFDNGEILKACEYYAKNVYRAVVKEGEGELKYESPGYDSTIATAPAIRAEVVVVVGAEDLRK